MVISHENIWIWKRLQAWGFSSGVWKHTILCNKVCLLLSPSDGYTKWEHWSSTILLPNVSSHSLKTYCIQRVCSVNGTLQSWYAIFVWRSQIYIKLTRFNHVIVKKTSLKNISVWNEMSYLMWNNFAFGFYRSVSVLLIFFASMSCKLMCNQFSTIFSWPMCPINLKLIQVCQFISMRWIT